MGGGGRGASYQIVKTAVQTGVKIARFAATIYLPHQANCNDSNLVNSNLSLIYILVILAEFS